MCNFTFPFFLFIRNPIGFFMLPFEDKKRMETFRTKIVKPKMKKKSYKKKKIYTFYFFFQKPRNHSRSHGRKVSGSRENTYEPSVGARNGNSQSEGLRGSDPIIKASIDWSTERVSKVSQSEKNITCTFFIRNLFKSVTFLKRIWRFLLIFAPNSTKNLFSFIKKKLAKIL